MQWRGIPKYLGLIAVLALAACAQEVTVQKFPEITFQHLGQLRLTVGSVEVVSKYKPTFAAPHVDHLFPTPPLKALQRWAGDRIKAAGGPMTARFVIYDASATETKLPRDTSIRGTFTKQQSERYTASVEVALEIRDARGVVKGHAMARARRSNTVREDASVSDRDRVWFELTDALVKDLDVEIEKNIRRHLVNWLR